MDSKCDILTHDCASLKHLCWIKGVFDQLSGTAVFPMRCLEKKWCTDLLYLKPQWHCFLSSTVRDKRYMLNQSCLQMLAILSEPWNAYSEGFSLLFSVFWDHEASMNGHGLPCCLTWHWWTFQIPCLILSSWKPVRVCHNILLFQLDRG